MKPGDMEVDIERYLGNDMSVDERREFEQRVLADPDLSRRLYSEMQTMSMLVTAAGEASEQPQLVRDHIRRNWWQTRAARWLVPAAAAAVVAFAVFLYPGGKNQPRDDTVFRGEHSSGGMYPKGHVDTVPARFVWPSRPGAVQYRFELFNAGSEAVFVSVVQDTFLETHVMEVPLRGYWVITPLGDALTPVGAETTVRYIVTP